MGDTDNKPQSETQALLDSRLAIYGDRVDNMIRVAKMWEGLFGFPVQPWQVPLAFALYKMYRTGITPNYSDNIDDAEGYLLMFREVVGDDMVQARTAEEYFEEIRRREREVKNAQFDDLIDPEKRMEQRNMRRFDDVRFSQFDPPLEPTTPSARQLEEFLDWLEEGGFAIYDSAGDHILARGREGRSFDTWFKSVKP